MLLASTTDPLPAQRPWSAGSMSVPSTLVLCEVLSTAFRPFTPVAPPEDELIWSQPGPNGWQLTAGGVGSAPPRGRVGDGRASGRSGEIADPASGLAAAEEADAAELRERDAVDGEKKGPVSREQPEAQPVAAGPAKVGEYFPKLDEVMPLVLDDVMPLVPFVTGAAPAVPEASISATGNDSNDSSATVLYTRFFLIACIPALHHWRVLTPGDPARSASTPHPGAWCGVCRARNEGWHGARSCPKRTTRVVFGVVLT